MCPFYTSLKTPEKQRFSGVFRGYKMRTFARGWLITYNDLSYALVIFARHSENLLKLISPFTTYRYFTYVLNTLRKICETSSATYLSVAILPAFLIF